MILKMLPAVYILLNVFSFLLYGADKKKAQKSEWRVKESTLILAAFLLGGTGALAGMKFFHHKTRHRQFVILVPAAALLNVAVTAVLCWLAFK